MSSYYKCNFFKKDKINEGEYNYFSLTQEQIKLSKIIKKQPLETAFIKTEHQYDCSFKLSSKFSPDRPVIIIPIRDNLNLLNFTISNLKKNNILSHANVIIVDDRSEEPILDFVKKEDLNYLRVDTKSGFNFSMLNNIPSKLCFDLGVETVIFWNSDLWCAKEEYFIELLKRHNENKSKLSGSKLIYPPKDYGFSTENDTDNIKAHFPELKGGKWRNTVQFGGDYWIHTPNSYVEYTPIHHKRFSNPFNVIVNCDRGALSITGALHVWDLKFFISLGGLNPSLPKIYQDNDVCLRVIETGNDVNYFGKDIHFFHDESLAKFNLPDYSKQDDQNFSDYILFGKIWNKKLKELIL